MVLLLLAGIAVLVSGAELLVRGASRAAAALGVAPILVGLTVVAFATSAPELAVTTAATLRGDPDLALGNVIGSNIANILLILGASAVVAPLVVQRRIVRHEVPLLIAVSLGVFLLALNGRLGRLEGGLLLAAGVAYTAFVARGARNGRNGPAEPAGGTGSALDEGRTVGRRRELARDGALIVAGLGLLVLGSQWLVEGAERIARTLGVSELAIGLTVVAVGTSLPELATSVVASLRAERDLAVGNIIGSNLFNLLFILGTAAALSPTGLAVSGTALAFDLPVMLGVTVACVPIFLTGSVVGRLEGLLFLAYFIAYNTYVLLAASGHRAAASLNEAVLYFAVPITVVTLGAAMLRDQSRRRRGRVNGADGGAGADATGDEPRS